MRRAPNGVVQDGLEYFGAGKPYYDPAKITVPTPLIHAECDRDTPVYMLDAVRNGLAKVVPTRSQAA